MLVTTGMSGAESILEQNRRKERGKKQAQHIRLQQDARTVSFLTYRNMASQRSCQQSLLPHGASVIRDLNTAR